MLGNEWVYAAVAVLLGAHLLTLLYAYRVRGDAATLGQAETDGPTREDPDDGTCRCPECGTVNQSGYRFCKQCISELPGARPQAPQPMSRGQPN